MGFEAVSWANSDQGSLDKFAQMVENEVWLYDNRVQATHKFDSNSTTRGVKILAMNHRIKTGPELRVNSGVAYNTIVTWPTGFFAPDCKPIVNVTLGTTDHNRAWISVRAPRGRMGDGQNWPDSTGCWIRTTLDPPAGSTDYRLKGWVALHIIAIGYENI